MRTLFGYAAFSSGWLMLMDVVLYDRFGGSEELQTFILSTDLLFVLLSVLVLYLLITVEEARRRKAEGRLMTVANRARCLLWDADLQVDFANQDHPVQWTMHPVDAQSACRVLPLAAATGEDYRQAWLSSRNAEDVARLRQICADALRNGETSYVAEYRCTNMHGEEQWIHEDVALEPNGPAHWQAHGVCIDITARKRAEHRLLENQRQMELVQRIGKIGYWELDVATRQITWSDEVFWLYVRDAAQGTPAYEENLELYQDEDAARLHAAIEAAIENGAEYELDMRLQLPNGSQVFHHLHMRPVLNAIGRVIKLSGTLQDITARKQAEEALREAHAVLEERVKERTAELSSANAALQIAKDEAEESREIAERANAAKNEFLSRMSHELRTPLNAILGFAQLLELDAETEAQQEAVEHILVGGQHLLGLINEVLDIARIESGRMAFSAAPVCVSGLLQSAIELVRPQAEQQKITLRCHGGRGLSVLADAQRLRQVLLNLLANAIKYNHEGGTVRIACEENSPGRLCIKVLDTGPGIPTELMGRLFTPFDRLGAERLPIEGTGLGLALSKRLMEAMGGSIGVESAPGQGSCFWIELPLAKELPLAGELPQTAERESRAASAKTVLYIEDNLDNLDLIRRLVQRHSNARLLSAMQGRLGLQLARDHQPDLVLLDLQLPDIHGCEVLRQLKSDPLTKNIPVVILSAETLPERVEQLLEHGAQLFLTKPLDLRQFQRMLQMNLYDHAGFDADVFDEIVFDSFAPDEAMLAILHS